MTTHKKEHSCGRHKFATVREIWEIFNSNLSKHVAPSEYLSTDETLYPMRQQIPPNSIITICYIVVVCTYKVVPYAAKQKIGDGHYYLKSTIDYIKFLVTEIEADQPTTGRTISIDRLYTSIESTNWLLDRGIATVGTLQKGRRGIPYDLFDTQNREIFSATCYFEKEKKSICVIPYTVKIKSKGEKNVVLSTSRPLHGKTFYDGKEKSQIIKFYDFIKVEQI